MTTQTQSPIDWAHWYERWERQQAGYLPNWEDRFTVMLDALDGLLPPAFMALDLASGPGTLSRRILARFPEARCIAVDLDPVTLAMGRAVHGDAGGRLRWLEADLMSAEWLSGLGEEQVDAALSTTALHWLPAEHLVRLYRELGQLIRPGGLFLNGDNLHFGAATPTFAAMSQRQRDHHWAPEALAERGDESWRQWWDSLAQQPAAAELIAERGRRFGWMQQINSGWSQPTYDLHTAALRDAGFREVGTIWQRFDNRVLLAVR